ncbi:MAG: DUF1311 domain-containing protein [Balneola sp.]|nr:MAG: DUF1311 domain-containing protein [Balneola sp.]
MKKLLVLLFFAVLTINTALSQTQTEMIIEAKEVYKKVDAELNELYQKIMEEYSDNSSFVEDLKKSQDSWIIYRDSELNLRYPDREVGHYASVHPMCVSNYLIGLTKERIERLQIWLTGIEERDLCSESANKEC